MRAILPEQRDVYLLVWLSDARQDTHRQRHTIRSGWHFDLIADNGTRQRNRNAGNSEIRAIIGADFNHFYASNTRRDDRTMSAGMMQERVDSIEAYRVEKITSLEHRMRAHLRAYVQGTPKYYAAAPSRHLRNLHPDTLKQRVDLVLRDARRAGMQPDSSAVRDSITATRAAELDTVGAAYRALTSARQLQAQALAEFSGIEFDEKNVDRFLVEIYKKYSIPVACFVFVLIGAPLGMMARRGGFGMGAGLSLGFFLFYWACLIGGEKLADRGELSPFWGMWVANIILGVMGVLLTIRTARESRVIDWSVFLRFVPKALRGEQEDREYVNPHEA